MRRLGITNEELKRTQYNTTITPSMINRLHHFLLPRHRTPNRPLDSIPLQTLPPRPSSPNMSASGSIPSDGKVIDTAPLYIWRCRKDICWQENRTVGSWTQNNVHTWVGTACVRCGAKSHRLSLLLEVKVVNIEESRSEEMCDDGLVGSGGSGRKEREEDVKTAALKGKASSV